jgi:hypothetical protein
VRVVAPDWDRAALRETQSADAYEADAYDADPDAENYAAGMDPETVYRNQGSPDGAGGWGRYLAEAPETDGASEEADLWGGFDPDDTNYADLDEPGEPEPAGESVPDAERPLSPEQQRISDLGAKNAEFSERLTNTERELAESRQETAEARQDASDAKQEAVEAKQDAAEAWREATEARQDAAEAKQNAAEFWKNAADSRRENAELRAEQRETNARVDRMEQVIAALADHNAQAVVTGDHHATITEGKATDQRMDARDAQPSRWRRSGSHDRRD